MTLERAIEITARAHAGQVDKAGEPYILHPLRIMLRMSGYEERIAAVLHDVVEDTPFTFDDLISEGLNGAALEAVRLVTKDPAVDYKIEAHLQGYLQRIKKHSIARAVKLGDLEDNLNVLRLRTVTEKDRARLDRYLESRRFLLAD